MIKRKVDISTFPNQAAVAGSLLKELTDAGLSVICVSTCTKPLDSGVKIGFVEIIFDDSDIDDEHLNTVISNHDGIEPEIELGVSVFGINPSA